MAATPDQLHTLALEAEECLEKFSTALASAGADDKAVQAIGQMADAVRQIAGMLGKSEPQPAAPSTDDAIGAHMAQRRAQAAAPQPPA
jgi:hypothetical protein